MLKTKTLTLNKLKTPNRYLIGLLKIKRLYIHTPRTKKTIFIKNKVKLRKYRKRFRRLKKNARVARKFLNIKKNLIISPEVKLYRTFY